MSATDAPAAPAVKLPQAVRMQAEKANAILKQQVEERFKEETSTGTQTVASVPEVQATQVVQPATPEAPKVEDDKTKTVEYWEHRFKTSQGMFEAEKTRLRTENSDLKSKLGGLEARMKELENSLKAAERSAPSKIDLKEYLSDEQIESYGPDILQSVLKIAENAAKKTSERSAGEVLERELAPLKQKVETAEKEARDRQLDNFIEMLDVRVPKWPVINNDPKFHEWLSQKDAFSGFTKQELLTHAEKALDHDRVIAIFEAYLQSSPAPKNTNVETQHRVVPDPVGQTQIVTQMTPDAPRVSRAEISQFYRDKALGRYKSRPQEAAKIEEKIRAAQLAGNVF